MVISGELPILDAGFSHK